MKKPVTTHEQPNEMTAKEVADFLRMPLPTVYHLAQKGSLPAQQNGGRWVFDRDGIRDLLGHEKPLQNPVRVVLRVGEQVRNTLVPALDELGVTVHDFPLDEGEAKSHQTVQEVIITDNQTRGIPTGFRGRVIHIVGGPADISSVLEQTSGPLTFSLLQHLNSDGLEELLGLAA